MQSSFCYFVARETRNSALLLTLKIFLVFLLLTSKNKLVVKWVVVSFFIVDSSTQNLLELIVFDITEILTFSISNCLSELLHEYSVFYVFPEPQVWFPEINFQKKTSAIGNLSINMITSVNIYEKKVAFKNKVVFKNKVA